MIQLTQKNPHTETFRFYRLDVIPSLLGNWGVQSGWGCLGKKGRMSVNWYTSQKEAESIAAQMAEKKLKAWCKELELLKPRRRRLS